MPRTPGDGEAQRDQILSAAVELLAESGADSLRMRDVAAAAGVSVGMIQYYFDSRDLLLEAAFRRYTEDVITRLRETARGPGEPWAKLSRLCRTAAAGAHVRRRSAVWLNLVDLGVRDDALRRLAREVYEAWVEAFHELIREGCDRGSFSPAVDATAAAEQLVAIVDGLDVASAIRRRGATSSWREERLVAAARALLG